MKRKRTKLSRNKWQNINQLCFSVAGISELLRQMSMSQIFKDAGSVNPYIIGFMREASYNVLHLYSYLRELQNKIPKGDTK